MVTVQFQYFQLFYRLTQKLLHLLISFFSHAEIYSGLKLLELD
jgi:hypothetical protein